MPSKAKKTTSTKHPSASDSLIKINVAQLGKKPVPIEAEWVAVFQSKEKKAQIIKDAYQSILSKLSESGAFTGGFRSLQFIRFAGQNGAEHVCFSGCGPASDFTEERARILGGAAYVRLASEKIEHLRVNADGFPASKRAKFARAFVEGVLLRAYEFRKYKTKGESESKLKSIIIASSDAKTKNELSRQASILESTQEAVNIVRDWSNEPSNHGTPEFYAKEAQRIATANGLKCKILTEEDAKREKMELYLGVGQGSDREGRIVVLEYNPSGASKNAKKVALVGKGVTFDSGGISIKPSLKMEDMKHDMTGAATLFGATLLAARMKVKTRIVTILAFTENMPSGHAITPGNIITSRNGKTVEIINTDAEGRLILADVIDYACDFEPDVIIDAATLTGAVAVALGKQCCGILGNDDGLIRALQKAGESAGERMWQLPLYDEYFEDMKSEYADMRNSANDALGGTIRGGIFLKQFIRGKIKWAHLDIASTAWDMGHLPYLPRRGASGLYVRAVARFIEALS